MSPVTRSTRVFRRVAGGILTVTVFGACSVPGIPTSVASLSRIGRSALPIGPEKETEIGFGIAATVAGRWGMVDDSALTRYVTLVGLTVAEQSVRRGEIAFRFGILATDDVNAYSTPGGYILVTRGAIGRMESEAELAGVLAHEVAHVDETHVLDEIRRSSVIASARDEADLTGPVLDRLAEAGGSLLFTGLSREDELEADSLAILYAAASGYRPDGLARFLERLSQSESAEETVREWTATHPSEADRLAAIQRQMTAAGMDPSEGQLLADRFMRETRGGQH